MTFPAFLVWSLSLLLSISLLRSETVAIVKAPLNVKVVSKGKIETGKTLSIPIVFLSAEIPITPETVADWAKLNEPIVSALFRNLHAIRTSDLAAYEASRFPSPDVNVIDPEMFFATINKQFFPADAASAWSVYAYTRTPTEAACWLRSAKAGHAVALYLEKVGEDWKAKTVTSDGPLNVAADAFRFAGVSLETLRQSATSTAPIDFDLAAQLQVYLIPMQRVETFLTPATPSETAAALQKFIDQNSAFLQIGPVLIACPPGGGAGRLGFFEAKPDTLSTLNVGGYLNQYLEKHPFAP